MPAGEFARDDSTPDRSGRPDQYDPLRPQLPLESVPRGRFDVPGMGGLRLRSRFLIATCSPTSRPWAAVALCLTGVVGLFLPLLIGVGGHGWTAVELAKGPTLVALGLFVVLTLLPVVDLVLGHERVTPWLAFPAALGVQVTIALAVVAAARGAGALHPELSTGVAAPGAGLVLMVVAEIGLAVIGGIGFARRRQVR
ncbi:hypothetical protein LQ327_22975 [Actinomycetospora endophytica]|uniref:Uncharacterized protein n=1 Tax=Actinomycetospora endophytica TaxID=2291215 RepID=A0ABS8PDA2_9PSEU|nr:hypothetical protein [Actinomycetospora endophytica]MCD2196242.1 hypothetical protein [Actinomycetospora endophytica]